MLFYVKAGDQERQIRVEMRKDEIFVTYGDEPEKKVDLFFYGNDCSFLNDNKVFSANVVGRKTQYTVWEAGHSLPCTVESEHKRIVNSLRQKNIESDDKITAKMPGKIVKIMIKDGDKVESGQAIMVMEAMKMENEIRSTIAGSVKGISVKEGQTVESGELLLEIDPA